MKVVAILAIVCGCLFIWGFLLADRIKITVHKVPHRITDLDVIVTVPHVTEEAHTLFLYGCLAEMSEEAHMFCLADGWAIESAHPVRSDQRQYPFPLRNVPRGWLMFSAVVVNAQGKTLAAGDTRLVR